MARQPARQFSRAKQNSQCLTECRNNTFDNRKEMNNDYVLKFTLHGTRACWLARLYCQIASLASHFNSCFHIEIKFFVSLRIKTKMTNFSNGSSTNLLSTKKSCHLFQLAIMNSSNLDTSLSFV